jgi:hypothetical protein
MAEPPRGGALARLLDPLRVAIDSGDAGGFGEHVRKEQAPVTDAAADIQDVVHGIEAPALRNELEEVEVPPVIAGVAEVLRGMTLLPFELVSHVRNPVARCK